MSANSDYAQHLIGILERVPSVAVKAAGSGAFNAVLRNTVQDSGQAAFNWNVAVNGEARKPYDASYGQFPVGMPWDKRSGGGDVRLGHGDPAAVEALINYKMIDFESAIAGIDAETLNVYNLLEDPAHERNADLGTAYGIATGADWLEDLAKRAADAYLQRSR